MAVAESALYWVSTNVVPDVIRELDWAGISCADGKNIPAFHVVAARTTQNTKFVNGLILLLPHAGNGFIPTRKSVL
jgi:hypothetical protein